MRLLALLTLLSFSIISFCQSTDKKSKFNLDFEENQNDFLAGWNNFGSAAYTVSTDSKTLKTGKYSACIEFKDGEPNFKALGFTLPNNYAGKRITISGYIKTENVTGGYAGLWMRIDPSIAFDNMNKNGVTGTTDWKKYEITLTLSPDKTKQIVVGALLVGKGKMWVDALQVTIDGKDIKKLKPYERKLSPSDKDIEFNNGSKLSSIPTEKNQIDKLKTLGLVWGFLKYYHPNVAKGDFNWDYELFRILPVILKTENTKDRDEVLINWINRLGKFSEGKESTSTSSDVKIEPDLGWINNSVFSDELVTLLLNVKNAKRSNEHHYVRLIPGVGNPDFKNENDYGNMKYPDAGFRLLALYRYWNIIQYYFPYRNLIEEDWKNVLEEFIPKILNASNETEYALVVVELIGRVHDTHANIWSKSAISDYLGRYYAALEISFVENKAVVVGYHNRKFGEKSGLVPGDIISRVNGRTTEDIVNTLLPITPASNYPTQLRDISRNLLRTNDSTLQIEFVRDEKSQTTVIKTFSLTQITLANRFGATDTCFKLINKDIAYINHSALKRKHIPAIWKEIKGTKGLIIDDRNYPSDFPIYDLSSYLMPEKKPFSKFTTGSIERPGLFSFGEVAKNGKKNSEYYKGRVIILTNEISQSSAEFHAMAYRVHPNATVIGSTTAGADGNVSAFTLPGGLSTMISGIGVYYPDGTETQRIGIIPDIEVKPTIKGIKEGRDEVLEKAIDLILINKSK